MHDEDKTTYEIKAKYDYSEGTLEINIPDLIAELDDDDKEDLARLHAFESAIWEEIRQKLRGGIASDTYNSNIHKLRIELLSGDGADRLLKETVQGILFDFTSARAGKLHYRNAYWALKRWCRDNLSPELRSGMPEEKEYETPERIRNEDVEKAIAEAQGEADAKNLPLS